LSGLWARHAAIGLEPNLNQATQGKAMKDLQTISPEELAQLKEMLDRQRILECQTRFTRAIDRFDRELFLSAFHSDAVISAGDFVGRPDKLYDWARDLHECGQTQTQHNILNHSCEIRGDVAHAETYYLYVACNRDGTTRVCGGRYLDRLERRDQSWKVAERFTLIEWSYMPPTADVPFADVPDIHGNGEPCRSKADPSYQRPLTNKRKERLPAGFAG
jgi:hypothetical protein